MSQQPFDPRRVLRQVSNALLRPFFQRHQLADAVPWSRLGETHIEPIFAAWHQLPEPQRRAVYGVLRGIHSLADDRGMKALGEQIHARQPDRVARFAAIEGAQDRAMWVYLHLPTVFDQAVLFAQADVMAASRFWATHNSLPRRPLSVGDDHREAFRDAISRFYWSRQLRGSCAEVEHHRRPDGDDYFFVYLDDYPDTRIIFNDQRRMERRTDRAAFANVFAYSAEEGTLSMYAKGGREVHQSLHGAFCRTVLQVDTEPCELLGPTYRLDHLLDPDFPLICDPEDRVAEARILAMDLEIHNQPGRRIGVRGNRYADDIHAMIRQCLSVPTAELTVRQAKFRLKLLGNSSRTMTFAVRRPHACDLRSKPEGLQAIGRRCLRSWGVLTDA